MFELESAADMSVEDNRKDALFAFDACLTEVDYATWARKYGRHLASYNGPIRSAIPNTMRTVMTTRDVSKKAKK